MTKYIGSFSDSACKILRETSHDVHSVEYTYKRPITIVQKENDLLVNAGIKTGVLPIKNLKDKTSFMDFINDIVHQNLQIKRHGSLNRYV